MTGSEIFKRTPTYDRESRNIRLHAPQWKLLLAFDGQRMLTEVALSADITFAEALPAAQNFLTQGWIEEQPITLEQYLKRAGAQDAGTGAAVPAAVVLHEPRAASAAVAATPSPSAVPHTPPPLPPAPAITPAPTAMATPKADAPLSPVTVLAPASPSSVRPMRLSAVVDFITSLSGNISLGQLLVYRVFLRVPPELLLAEDVASVHLAHDTSIIRGEKLQKAIANAIDDVAKRQLPDSVFAPA